MHRPSRCIRKTRTDPGIVSNLIGLQHEDFAMKVVFYGVGGGIDLEESKHLGLRFQSTGSHEFVRDLLRNPQYTWRMSASPTFRFGKNVTK